MNALERGLMSALLYLAATHLLAADPAESTNQNALTITQPSQNAALARLAEIKGSIVSQSGRVDLVQVRLKSLAGRNFSEWQSAEWTADKDSNAQLSEWKVSVPKLKEGAYEIECRALQAGKTILASSVNTFAIDRTAPVISFFPLRDQKSVVDFSEIGGEIDKAAQIQFSICRVNDSEELNRYWNGSEWSASPDSPGVKLRGSSNRDYWFPSAETPLPKIGQIERGMYLISASAVDGAGNLGRAAVTVLKIGTVSSLESTALRR